MTLISAIGVLMPFFDFFWNAMPHEVGDGPHVQ
jgi:hypothetical protein